MRNSCIRALSKMAGQHSEVVVIVGDNGTIVFDNFRSKYPEQFINCGIAEANMISSAAGMASAGLIPVTYTIIPFLTMRAFEQIRNDVCLQKQNVKLLGIGAGCSYSALGPTHHAIEDIALMRVLPGLTILSPATPAEAYQATIKAVEMKGPVYLRLGTGKEKEVLPGGYEFKLGKALTIHEGTDISVFTTGSIIGDVLEAAKAVSAQGISVSVVNVSTLKPFDSEAVIREARKTHKILSVEEHSIMGGLGSIISEILAEEQISVKFRRLGIRDEFCKGYGDHAYVKASNKLSITDIQNAIREMISA